MITVEELLKNLEDDLMSIGADIREIKKSFSRVEDKFTFYKRRINEISSKKQTNPIEIESADIGILYPFIRFDILKILHDHDIHTIKQLQNCPKEFFDNNFIFYFADHHMLDDLKLALSTYDLKFTWDNDAME